jgi:hypothetical protein
MKTFVIVSDSHGNRSIFEKLDTVFSECDYIIHLGDTSADGNYLRGKYGEKVYVINGNCDPIKVGDDEKVLSVEGHSVLCCHGHRYGVKYSTDKLVYRAKELGCDIALYGHTHHAAIEEMAGVSVINPGTLSRYSHQTYCYMVLHEGMIVAKTVDCNT